MDGSKSNRLPRRQTIRPALQRQAKELHKQSRKDIQPAQIESTPDSLELASSSFANIQPVLDAAQAITRSSAKFWALLIIAITSLVWAAGMVIGFENALSINLAIGFILAIVGLTSPSLGLLSIGVLAALDAMAAELLYTGGLLRFNTLNYWLLIVMILYLPFILRLRDLNSRTIELFVLLLALELSFSQNISSGAQDVLNIATTFGMVIYFARGLKDEQTLYWLGIVNGVLAGLGGLIFLLQINQLPYTNPNNWTYFQLTALFSICISFPYARVLRKNRVVLLLLAVVNVAWIFLSASRGSLLIALLCVVYLFLSTRSITLSSVMIALAILVGLWVSTQFVEQQSYTISRIQLLFDPTLSSTKRTSKRSNLAEAGIALFQANPLGIGTGSFREESSSTTFISGDRPAHSAWIKTLAENGVPGIILMVAFIGAFAIEGFRKHQEGKILFGLFIAIVFASAFIAKEFRGKSLWFLAAGGIVLLHPEEMLEFLNRKLKPNDIDYRKRLREIRFGRRK